MPVIGDIKPRGALLYQCSKVVKDLNELHFRSSDYPPFLKDAAALFDTSHVVANVAAGRYAKLDLAEPYAASARILGQLKVNSEVARLREDLLRSAEDLSVVTPLEAFHYGTGNWDYFSKAQLAELDFAKIGRFEWLFELLTNNSEDNRNEWLETLFEDVAEQLNISELFDYMPDADETMSSSALIRTWSDRKKIWLRDTVSALPDYAARRDDHAELRAFKKEYLPDYGQPDVKDDTVLFDLLMEKGIRRTGSTRLKLKGVDQDLGYYAESVNYEHHETFKEVDWVWLINTTGAPQMYYQSAEQPFLEDAIWREPEDREATFWWKQMRAAEKESERKKAEDREKRLEDARRKAEKREKRLARKRNAEVVEKNTRYAPSKPVTDMIRGWLKRT